MKKGVGPGVGSISQRYGSGDPDPQQKSHGSPTMLVIKVILCMLEDVLPRLGAHHDAAWRMW